MASDDAYIWRESQRLNARGRSTRLRLLVVYLAGNSWRESQRPETHNDSRSSSTHTLISWKTDAFLNSSCQSPSTSPPPPASHPFTFPRLCSTGTYIMCYSQACLCVLFVLWVVYTLYACLCVLFIRVVFGPRGLYNLLLPILCLIRLALLYRERAPGPLPSVAITFRV